MAKNKRKEVQPETEGPRVPKQVLLQRKKTARNRIILVTVIIVVALTIFTTWLVIDSQAPRNTLGMKVKTFEDTNKLFKLEVPMEWDTLTDLAEVLEFGQGLDLPNFAFLAYPKGTVYKLKPKDIFKGTIITMAVFTKGPEQQEKISIYAGYMGGLTENPEKFYMEGLEKQGVKIPGTKYGYYSLVGGIPSAIVKTNENVIVFGGNAASDEELKVIEEIFKSIQAP